MTVSELIAALQAFPPDTPVAVPYLDWDAAANTVEAARLVPDGDEYGETSGYVPPRHEPVTVVCIRYDPAKSSRR